MIYTGKYRIKEETHEKESFEPDYGIHALMPTELVFTHASDYIIVIGAEMMDGSEDNSTDNTESTEAGNQSAPELTDDTDGQSVWNTTVIIIAGICILLLVIGAVWYVRKKESGKE